MDLFDDDVFDGKDDISLNNINKIKSKLYNEGFSDGRLQGIKDLVYQRVKEGFKRGMEVGMICGALYSECSIFHHKFNAVDKNKLDELLKKIRHILVDELPNEVDTSKLLPELQVNVQELATMVEVEGDKLLQKYNEFLDGLKRVEEKFGPVVSTNDAAKKCCGGTGACK
jgi:hypothetical protein